MIPAARIQAAIGLLEPGYFSPDKRQKERGRGLNFVNFHGCPA